VVTGGYNGERIHRGKGGAVMGLRRIKVNPRMLVWAREKAGYDVIEAAHGLGFRDGKTASAVDKLLKLESGETDPTVKQLSMAAEFYRRPKALFLRPAPPREDKPLTDYRRLAASDVTDVERGWLDSLQRLVINRVEVLREVLEDGPDFKAPSLPYSSHLADGEETVAARICEAMQFNPLDRRARGRSPAEFFRELRKKAESNAGVFTFVISRFGMSKPDLPPTVYRGFAIADRIAPAIVVNGLDSASAKVFSLFHEMAHIALGDSAISGGRYSFRGTDPEAFCNRVAASILLPSEVLVGERAEFAEDIRALAATWKVSPLMTAYRLHSLRLISAELRDEFALEPYVPRQRGPRAEKDSGGPSAHDQWKAWIGSAAISVIGGAVDEGRITAPDAARAFGIKPTSVHGFLEAIKRSNGGVY